MSLTHPFQRKYVYVINNCRCQLHPTGSCNSPSKRRGPLYHKAMSGIPPDTLSMSTAIKGVIIRPNGDVNIHYLARFADKYVLPTDPIFADVLPTEMSVRLELPLLICRLNPKEIVPEDTYHRNRPATFLQMRPCTGFAPPEWERQIGAVLVVRQDRKPLACLHLEAVWRYHWTLLSDIHSVGWDRGCKSKISRRSFETFWYDYRNRQLDVGREEFEQLVSPYEI